MTRRRRSEDVPPWRSVLSLVQEREVARAEDRRRRAGLPERAADQIPVFADDDGLLYWRPGALKCAEFEERLASVELRATDWINECARVDELTDDPGPLDGDAALCHYARCQPDAILDETDARWRALGGYAGDRGSPVSDPWAFAGVTPPDRGTQ